MLRYESAAAKSPSTADQHPTMRVTCQEPRLPFRVPEIPAWVAVPVMSLVVLVMAVVASLAVLS